MRPTRDETMLDLARVIARRSTCARRNVGAVLTDSYGRVLAIAYNGVAMGQPHCVPHPAAYVAAMCGVVTLPEGKPCAGAYQQSGQGLDLCEAIHAEQNALAFCQDIMKIDTVYVTTAPCVHCVKMLMNTTARRVVFEEGYAHDERSRDLWTADGTRTWEHNRPTAGPDVSPDVDVETTYRW